MKRILCFILIITCVVCLVSCSKTSKQSEINEISKIEETIQEEANLETKEPETTIETTTPTSAPTEMPTTEPTESVTKEPLDLRGEKIGLVLAGGGTKGAYEAGALKALSEIGLLDNVIGVSGTSIGSVNLGILYGSDMKTFIKLWKNVNSNDFVSDKSLKEFKEKYDSKDKLLDFVLSGAQDGLCSRDGMVKIIKKNTDLSKISKSKDKVFYVTGAKMSLLDSKAEYFKLNGLKNDEIIDRILASSAIPVLYPQEEIDGYNYADGGLFDNVPITPLYNENIRNFIVITTDCNFEVSNEEYPDASFYIINPSVSLGENLIDMLNFTQETLDFQYYLGYYDAKEYVNSYINGKNPELKENESIARKQVKNK